MKEIDITQINNIRIGHMHDKEHATGCTVVLCDHLSPCGLDVRGGGPASRESELLHPSAASEGVHAVLLSGGSAFGLDAAGGVMQFLEERGIGLDVGVSKVPLVVQSCIFDLSVGSSDVRPDKKMGYAACLNAEKKQVEWGNVGAGCGASVGKMKGMDHAMKSGIASYAIESGTLQVGAIVCVNAIGDIYDSNNHKIAGMLKKDTQDWDDSLAFMEQMNTFPTMENTTLAVVITNAAFSKAQMKKVAQMAQNAYPRCIRPVHTSMDGDSVYALSTGEVSAALDVVGSIAQEVLCKAIERAIYSAVDAYGLPSVHAIHK